LGYPKEKKKFGTQPCRLIEKEGYRVVKTGNPKGGKKTGDVAIQGLKLGKRTQSRKRSKIIF